MILGNDNCPERPALAGYCADCLELDQQIQAINAARRKHLATAIRLMKKTGAPAWADIERAGSEPAQNILRLKSGPTPPCARHILYTRLEKSVWWKSRRLASIGNRMEKDAFWTEIVPSQYQVTNKTLLPRPDLAETILQFERRDDPAGVLLFGSSGQGKTRCAFLLLEKWLYSSRRGWRFNYVEGSAIADAANARSRSGGVGDWIDEITATNALFIDDLGHGNFSNSYAEALRRIIERCTANNVPLIVTLQFDGRALLKQWTREEPGKVETAKAILRRLSEFCRPVNFDRPKTKR